MFAEEYHVSETLTDNMPHVVTCVGLGSFAGWASGIAIYITWPALPIVMGAGTGFALLRKAVYSHVARKYANVPHDTITLQLFKKSPEK